jgi:hypothetical protein
MLSGEMAKWSLILMAGVLLHSASFVMEPSTDRKMNKEETGIIIERNTAALFTKKSKDASDKTELMNFLKISSGEYLMAQPLPLCAMYFLHYKITSLNERRNTFFTSLVAFRKGTMEEKDYSFRFIIDGKEKPSFFVFVL